MELNYTDFKAVVESRNMSLQSVVVGSNLWLSAMDGVFSVTCLIPTDVENADNIDWESNYASRANKSPKSKVLTEFELEDKVLRLASIEGTFDVDGLCVLEILVPGTFDPFNPSRLIAQAYLLENVFGWGDRLIEVNIVDKDNVIGYGANTVIEIYHDAEVPAANKGWRFYPTEQGMGEIEIEPVGGFGRIPGGVYIQAKVQRAVGNTATKLIADVWWGAPDSTDQ